MKKKIRELTREDIKKLCNQHECYKCPLNIKTMFCWILIEQLDKEVEIEE